MGYDGRYSAAQFGEGPFHAATLHRDGFPDLYWCASCQEWMEGHEFMLDEDRHEEDGELP